MNRHKTALAATVMVALCTTVTSAAMVDDFLGQQVIDLPTGGMGGNALGPIASVVGGNRKVQLESTGRSSVDIDVPPVGASLGDLALGSGVDGMLTLTYDGTDDLMMLDPMGLGGIDLTAGGATGMFVEVINSQLPGAIAEATFYDMDGDSDSQTINIPQGGPSTPTFDFASFAPAVDFTNIGAIVVKFTPGTSGDLRLASIQTIPEPTTAALLGAVGVVGLMHRRRSKKA